MRAKQVWTVQSLASCFVLYGLTAAVFFYTAKQILNGMRQWVDPFLKTSVPGLPEEAQSAFANLNQLIAETGAYLAPVLFGTAAIAAFFLWLIVLSRGRAFAARAAIEAAPPISGAPVKAAKEEARPEKKITQASPPPQQPAQASPQPAVQLLSILQREGRLVDFLQEDLSLYDDSQIGAAVRSIHQGCRQALSEYVELKPVFEESEGAGVTVPAGFDARAIRLTGNVTGTPPFKGSLRHRGWRVTRVQLPQPSSQQQQKNDWILAPAEVEVEG